MARVHYARSVAFDTDLRNSDPRYAIGTIDERHVRRPRTVVVGSALDQEIEATVGPLIEYFPRRKNHSASAGAPAWRELARKLAQGELQGLALTSARDDGDPDPLAPAILEPKVEVGLAPTPAPRVPESRDDARDYGL